MGRKKKFRFEKGQKYCIRWGKLPVDIEIDEVTPRKIVIVFLGMDEKAKNLRPYTCLAGVREEWWRGKFTRFMKQKCIRQIKAKGAGKARRRRHHEG
jgi:hypothetical protein